MPGFCIAHRLFKFAGQPLPTPLAFRLEVFWLEFVRQWIGIGCRRKQDCIASVSRLGSLPVLPATRALQRGSAGVGRQQACGMGHGPGGHRPRGGRMLCARQLAPQLSVLPTHHSPGEDALDSLAAGFSHGGATFRSGQQIAQGLLQSSRGRARRRGCAVPRCCRSPAIRG